MPQISIVIVTWNSSQVLAACVNSLYAHVPESDFELFIVDNDSAEKGYLEEFRGRPNLTVIQNSGNFGYAKAVNIGFHRSQGEYFLVMNPDMAYTANPFPRLKLAMSKDTEIGVIGPMLYDGDGHAQIHDFYPTLPTISQYIFHRTVFRNVSAIKKYALKRFHANIAPNGITFVEQIPGAFLFMRRNLFNGNPPLNENFFIWMEDVDFCKQIILMGKKIAVVADEKITHFGGKSFELRDNLWRNLMFTQSYITYVSMHSSLPAFLIHTGCMALNSLIIILPLPITLVWKGPKKVKARVSVESKVLKMILNRIVLRIFRPGSAPPNQGQFTGF